MLASIIAALGMCADGVAEGLYATRHKFSPRAAAAGLAIGAIIGAVGQVVTPVTFTVESITVAANHAQRRTQVLWIVALSAVPSIILGALGLYSTFVNLLDGAVVAGAIAGVGIILAKVGFGYIKDRMWAAGVSTLSGVVAYLVTGNLVLVILAAVIAGTLAARLDEGSDSEDEDDEPQPDDDPDQPKVGFPRPHLNALLSRPVVIGAFAVFALRTGAVVSYTNVNANLAGTEPSLDTMTLIAGLASLASSLLGGPPIETTPAPMAAAPMPVFSTVLFMALLAAITGFGLVRRAGRFIPLQAIAGFLVVLGILVVLPNNLPTVADNPFPGGTALAVTAMTNPFYGILAGQAIAFAMSLGLTAGIS